MNILKRIFRTEAHMNADTSKRENPKPPQKLAKRQTVNVDTHTYTFYTEDRVYKLDQTDLVWKLGNGVKSSKHLLDTQGMAFPIDENTFLPVHSIKLIKRKLKHTESITYDLEKIREGNSPELCIISAKIIEDGEEGQGEEL